MESAVVESVAAGADDGIVEELFEDSAILSDLVLDLLQFGSVVAINNGLDNSGLVINNVG